MSESTLPRIVSSLASIRWIVGSESPESSASMRWSMLSSARAARICADVIMRVPSTTRVDETGNADSKFIDNDVQAIILFAKYMKYDAPNGDLGEFVDQAAT